MRAVVVGLLVALAVTAHRYVTGRFVISAGPSGKVAEITAAVTFAIGGLLLAADELLPRD